MVIRILSSWLRLTAQRIFDREKEEVRPTIEKAFSSKGPVVMDFRIDPTENVFPMVPAGQAIHRMIGTMA